jgi:hypothetical protein
LEWHKNITRTKQITITDAIIEIRRKRDLLALPLVSLIVKLIIDVLDDESDLICEIV